MRTLFAIAALASMSMPAFAEIINGVPEPETLALLAIGVAGLVLARRRKK